MLCSLVAYDDAYNVIATLDHRVAYDAAGNAVELVDFSALHGHLTDVWTVETVTLGPDGAEIHRPARGSQTWPEWLGQAAHDFRAELEGKPGAKRLAALVHRASGYRRERRVVEEAIAARIQAAAGLADIRDLVGGPDRPLLLDSGGRTVRR